MDTLASSPRDATERHSCQRGDALIVVHVQNDFLPGGALAVPGGDEVIEPINSYIQQFTRRQLPVFATRDWHPQQHCSFREHGGPWPAHCVAGTHGAKFSPRLQLPQDVHVISQATQAESEAYSGFQGTDLARQLRDLGCTRLFVGGLATEYCVRATVLDARLAGLEVVVLAEAIRALDAQPGDGERALAEMKASGAQISPAQPPPGAGVSATASPSPDPAVKPDRPAPQLGWRAGESAKESPNPSGNHVKANYSHDTTEDNRQGPFSQSKLAR